MAKRESKSGPREGSASSPARSAKTPAAPPRPILVVTGSVGQGTPARGGWGYVICYPSGQEAEAGGVAPETTGARMALTAVIRALERLTTEGSGRAAVRVVTSSQATVDGASGKAERRANHDLWGELEAVSQGRPIVWEWEPDETMYLQERAAELARLAMKRGGS
jgi:ribonuclease HI